MTVAESLPLSRVRLAPQPRVRPTLAWCYVAIAPVMVFILCCLDRSYQTDLWHHLARGRVMLQTGTLLNHDIFTFTLFGQPIVDNNWLTQIAAAKLFAIGGIGLLQTVNAAVLSAAIAITVWSAITLGATARAAGLTAAGAVVMLSPVLLIRPQTVSIVLFAVLLRVLIAATRRPAWLIAAPALIAAWANVHGAFPVGVAVVGCFAVNQWRRPTRVSWVAALLASVVAMLANPYGWRVFAYVRQTSQRSTARSIQEWLPHDPHSASGIAWLVSVIAVVAIVYWRRHRAHGWMWLTLVAFGILSGTSVRMEIWWLLAAAMIVPVLLSDTAREQTRSNTIDWPAAGLLGTMLACCVLALPAIERFNPIFRLRPADRVEDSLETLAQAIQQTSPNARVFTRLEWGEYLSYALPWQHSVYLDGRIEIIPDDVWAEYRRITTAEPDWQALLDARSVTVLLLDTHYHDGLLQRVAASPQWIRTTTAGTGALFIRSGR